MLMWVDIHRLEAPQTDVKVFHTIAISPDVGLVALGWYFSYREEFDDGSPITNRANMWSSVPDHTS